MANKRKLVEIKPPVKGIVKSLDYQRNAPYSCYDALNVMSFDQHEERGRVGSRPALALAYTAANGVSLGGPVTLVDTVRYVDTATDQVKTKIVAVADGKFWAAAEGGDLAAVGTERVGYMVTMRGTSYLGKYYLADHGPVYSDTNGVLTVAGTNTFTSGSLDFSDDYVVTAGDDLEILSTGAGGNATIGVYNISTVSTTTLTIDGSPGASDTAISFRILKTSRPIKVYDPSANTFTTLVDAGTGTVPTDCKSIATFYDRLVAEKGREWYMCHMGDPTDWAYGTDEYDVERAVAGANTQAGLIPFPCKAIVAHGDSCCLFFTGTELHIMRGNPARGGRIDTIDQTHGCVSNTAICAAPGGHYFLSKNGLCAIPLGCNSFPKNISRPILPQEMIEIDADHLTGRHVTMEYSLDLDTVLIMLSPRTASAATEHWIYQPGFDAFWKWTWPTTGYQPHSMCKLKVEGSGRQEILIGCNDGKVYRLDLTQEKDVSTVFASYVDIGPLRIGDGFFRGEIQQMNGVLSNDTTDVTWEVRVGDTCESAAKQTAATSKQSGIFYGNSNNNEYNVGAGEAAMIKIAADTTNTNPGWGLSTLTLVVSQEGDLRR